MSTISGKNAILYVQYNGEFLPVACFKSISLNTHLDNGETSSLNTGKWRTLRGTKLSWSATASGLCSLDTNITIPQLRNMQFTMNAVFLQWNVTDTNNLTENFSGFALITDITENTDVTGFLEYQATFDGEGEIAITEQVVDPNECCDTEWYFYTASGGEYDTGPIPALVGYRIDGDVIRDGVGYRPSGALHDGLSTPIGKQYKFDKDTGRIYFDTNLQPLQTGEQVDIPYLTCTDDNTTPCEAVLINDKDLPNAVVGVPYFQIINLTGTAPISLTPGWQSIPGTTISLTGNKVTISGVPTTEGTNVAISFKVSNCTGNTDTFDDTVNVYQQTDFSVELSRNGNQLTAFAIGGVGPYTYHFYCVATGNPCFDYNIVSPDGTVPDEVTAAVTDFSYTQYAGSSYTFYCEMTDSLGQSAISGGITPPNCLVPETMILMEDGIEKELKFVQEGDKLFDSIVTAWASHIESKLYSINAGLLKSTGGHIHILKGNILRHAEELKEGDLLIDKNGNDVEITNIEILEGEFEVINISTDTKEYIANGIRTHNKLSC